MWKCHTENKQLPIPDEDSLVFWEGCKRQRLLIQQCDECDRFRFPPSPLCPSCLSMLATWREDAGTGEVLTYCVYHSELAGPAWQAELPYVVVVVQLQQSGVKMLSQLRCSDPSAVQVGQAVQVRLESVDTRVTLPLFELVRTAADAPAPPQAVSTDAVN